MRIHCLLPNETRPCPSSSRCPQDRVWRPQVAEPAGVQALQPRRGGRRQDDEGAPAVLGGLLAYLQQPAVRPVRRRHGDPALGRRHRLGGQRPARRARSAFEFFEKLGAPFYAFHDRDVAPEGKTLKESHANLDEVVKVLKDEQGRTGVKLLWGTANLFSNPRYMHGAATSPNLDVFAYAAAQVKKALEVTHELGGLGYTFWGGREGYSTLLNTDMKREVDHLARFLHMAVDYKKQIGFGGPFYIEPKPKEPTKHQYDSDAAACLNFLRTYDLLPHFKLNLETNHATLAGHEMMHELEVAIGAGALGSIDANTGDPLLGWDTDQFPTEHLPDDPVHALHPRAWAASPPAASTSTPRSAARASSRSTCSTPTSAAWTPSPAA